MLAAEYRTLPKPMQDAVIKFFDENEAWLEAVLVQGQEEGTLEFADRPSDAARHDRQRARGCHARVASLRDPARFQATAARLFASLTKSSSATELTGAR